MRLSNNLLRAHLSGFEKAIVALRAANGQSRLHDEIAELFSQNVQVAGDDALQAAIRTAMQQIAAAVPDLPAQQASKYQNWLLTRYRQNWANQTEINPPQPLLLEDLSKYAEDLALYHNTSNVIKKRAGISTDLFTIDNPFELYQQLKALRGEVATEFKQLTTTQQAFIDSNEAVIIGQTAQWRLVMPLTIAASQEFGAGTRWCTAARDINYFEDYFPNNVLLYLEASGPDKASRGKYAFVLQNGKITELFDAEDTQQTQAQRHALLDKLPTLAAQLQNFDVVTFQLKPAIDMANFTKAFDLTIASRNLAPYATINDATLAEKVGRSNFSQADKDKYLGKAAGHGLLATTKALLATGAKVYADGNYALRLAASNGHTETVKLLIKHGADVHADYDEALRWAAGCGHTETIKLLLKHGADIHANNDEALRVASGRGNTETVKLLLKHGAKINTNDNYALRRAAENGHTETVRLLLKHGANVHANNDEALLWATKHGRAETVRLLLKHGADIHANNNRALSVATAFRYTEVVKILEAHIAKEAAAQTSRPEKPVAKRVAGSGQQLN